MSLNHSPSIITSGLQLLLDAANTKSYPGSGTTWTDLSGNARNATLTNGPTYNSTNNGFITFDGVNDYAGIPSFNITGTSISIFSWFKFNSLQTTERAIVRKDNIFQLGLINPSTGSVRILLGTGTVTGWTAANDFTQSFANNTWYYFGFVYNNGTTTVYLNGSLIRTITAITGSLLTNTSNIAIANNTDGSLAGGTLNIAADISVGQVQIYNTSLTAAQVSQNFNALRGRYSI